VTAGRLCCLGETVTAADGMALGTDLYLPEVQPAATLLFRTPYARAALAWECMQWTSLGYACVVQDVRQILNPGAVSQWDTEAEDGRATLDWINRQPWADGRVVLIGTAAEVEPAVAAAQTGHSAISGLVVIAPGSLSSAPPPGPPRLEWPVWSALSGRVGRPSASLL